MKLQKQGLLTCPLVLILLKRSYSSLCHYCGIKNDITFTIKKMPLALLQNIPKTDLNLCLAPILRTPVGTFNTWVL